MSTPTRKPATLDLAAETPIAPNRALVVADRKAMLSADAIRRLAKVSRTQSEKVKFYITLSYFDGWQGLVIFITFYIFTVVIGGMWAAMNVLLFLIPVVGLFLVTAQLRAERLKKAKEVWLPCPSCNVNINLAAVWACGNCKHEHNTEDDPALTVPVSPCADGCSQPEQTAFQCLECHRHIVLNEDLYLSSASFVEPHSFVARYSKDDAAPIPNKKDTKTFFDD